MKVRHKRIQTLAALVGLICFVTGVTSLPGLRRKIAEWLDDAKVEEEAGRAELGASTGRGVPPGCQQLDDSGQQVGLWRDECEQCREGATFDLACIRKKGIDPFKAPPRPVPSQP